MAGIRRRLVPVVLLGAVGLLLGACESSGTGANASGYRRLVVPAPRLTQVQQAALGPSGGGEPGVTITYPRSWNVTTPPRDVPSAIRFSISNRAQRALCRRSHGMTSCARKTRRHLPPSSVVLTFEWLQSDLLCPTGTDMKRCSYSLSGPVTKVGDTFAERRTAPGDACVIEGADRDVSYRGRTMPPNGREYVLAACIRGPQFHRLDDQVERAMRSVRFTVSDR